MVKIKYTLYVLLLSFSFFYLINALVIEYKEHREQIKLEEAKLIAQRLEEERHAYQKMVNANKEYIKCMATNIYHEARNEPFMGQVAVARVVMNRVKHGFASNPCRVVYQVLKIPDLEHPEGVKKVCQFSWVCENKGPPKNNPKYAQAEAIAKQVLLENKWKDEIPGNVLFFHNTSVDPEWNYKKTMIIGNHIFYSKK